MGTGQLEIWVHHHSRTWIEEWAWAASLGSLLWPEDQTIEYPKFQV